MNTTKRFFKNFRAHINEVRSYILAFLVLVVGAGIAMTIHVHSAIAGPGKPFGGLITSVTNCTCTGNYAIYFNDLNRQFTGKLGSDVPSSDTSYPDPVTLPLIYEPGVTILYEFGMITTPGVWMLGTWIPGGECRVGGKFCMVVPTAGTMYMVGTSK